LRMSFFCCIFAAQNGKIVTRTDSLVDIESLSLQPGVYVVKTIFSNDTFETNKIIK